ncbi:hypothetical protein MJN85_10345, partial [Salmonella enterica subsp. enterica serovar Anatum]|nr:hypothetical protein [Salmonella enterica subsp. enterica serovar Anatum]
PSLEMWQARLTEQAGVKQLVACIDDIVVGHLSIQVTQRPRRSMAFLVGPPLLGYLGEHYGLRSAMMVVLALVILAALVAKAVAKPVSTPQPVMEHNA